MELSNEKIPLLDHGYVQLIESWGSDERIIEAARMSTGKGFLGWGGGICSECSGCSAVYKHEKKRECPECKGTGLDPGDGKLLRYLWGHKHTTPFEMAGATFEVQAPIMVFREWHRHRTQSYNEMSARYTPLPDINYVPTVDRLLVNAGTSNKQAGTVKGAEELTEVAAKEYRLALAAMWDAQETLYQKALLNGVPKELARLHLGVGRYSRMMVSTDLLNWTKFLFLRMAPGAQFEIRCYANVIAATLRSLFPRTMELFDESRQKIPG